MAVPASLRQDLCDIPILDDPGSLRMRSRDFFWFSPILKETLDDKRADIVAVPRDKPEVMRVAAACAGGSAMFPSSIRLNMRGSDRRDVLVRRLHRQADDQARRDR